MKSLRGSSSAPVSPDRSDRAARGDGPRVLCDRRGFLLGGATAAVVSALPGFAWAQAQPPAPAEAGPPLGPSMPFSRDVLLDIARRRAAKPNAVRPIKFPPSLAKLTYDQYREIRYKRDKALWADGRRGFKVEPFHAGFLFRTPVSLYVVDKGTARRVQYATDLFDWGPAVTPPPPDADLPFSGFRLRHPINKPDLWDEFLVFQGASYFRAVARGQLYGLSARGLAVKTGDPTGEEFPAFTAFWLETPEDGAQAFALHALLESDSCTGAYRFLVRPGRETVMDVEMTLFPRVEIKALGLAPLTSMFLFDGARRNRVNDFRRAVHDSDGLAMLSGRGEHIWRPLSNPATLQISSFIDQTPRGFGLVQRSRSYADYEDLDNRYEKRPSAWIEPIGDWGAGSVNLVEIPSEHEDNDNIVAFWRPKAPIPANKEFSATYRIRWCDRPPVDADLAWVTATRIGPNLERKTVQFVVDFALPAGVEGNLAVQASTSAGTLLRPSGRRNPVTGGYRARFELDPGGADLAELRLRLLGGDAPASETWLYRWLR